MTDNVPLIPIHRELVIRAAADVYEDLGSRLEDELGSAWIRERQLEMDEVPTLSYPYQIFAREAVEGRPALRVFLAPRNGDVYIANVVPQEIGSISIDEYNRTVEEFADEVARPAANTLGLEVLLGGEYLDLSEEFDQRAYRALRTFSRTSNRSTGSSHPSDREKWFEFLCCLRDSGGEVTTGHLIEWLRLDGWAEEAAYELGLEFEFGMGLLRYDQRR